MLQQVDVGERSLGDYRGVAPDVILDDLLVQAEQLRGARVLHVNATPYGGGVAELLRSVVPLLNDLGIIADWKVIGGDEAFFQVTKAIHNGLQGSLRDLTVEQQRTYLAHAKDDAARLTEDYDFIFIHDPQPAALLTLHGKGKASWIWRCHIDTSHPNPAVWQFLQPFLTEYDAAIFTMREFVPRELPIERVEITPPAIDPLSPKNLSLPKTTARQILGWSGIQLDHPPITQVARFDPWKDPLGVIAAYRQVRQHVPNAQLALVGSMALDDPEGWEVYRQIQTASAADPLIHIFTNLTGVGNIEVTPFNNSRTLWCRNRFARDLAWSCRRRCGRVHQSWRDELVGFRCKWRMASAGCSSMMLSHARGPSCLYSAIRSALRILPNSDASECGNTFSYRVCCSMSLPC